eukprot:276698-Hanusia_phi.AAC.1
MRISVSYASACPVFCLTFLGLEASEHLWFGIKVSLPEDAAFQPPLRRTHPGLPAARALACACEIVFLCALSTFVGRLEARIICGLVLKF